MAVTAINNNRLRPLLADMSDNPFHISYDLFANWLAISNVPESEKKSRKNRSGQAFRTKQYRTARKLNALLQPYPQHLRASRSVMEPQVDSTYHLTQKTLKPIYPKQKYLAIQALRSVMLYATHLAKYQP